MRKPLIYWSGKRDLNPRPQPWQGCALPLSYSRLDAGFCTKRPRKTKDPVRLPRTPHRWRVSPRRAIEIQKRLAERVSLLPAPPIRRVLGLDCAFTDEAVFAVGVVWDVAARRVLEARGATAPLTFPYVPGLLSFREAPVLLRVMRRTRHAVDALMCDGQGIAHPRRFGLASHLGVIAQLPACGVAKSILVGVHVPLGSEHGATAPLVHRGERLGTAVRTRAAVKPVYASPGQWMTCMQAAELALACANGYRMPEPTRLADRWVAMLKRGEISMRGLNTPAFLRTAPRRRS